MIVAVNCTFFTKASGNVFVCELIKAYDKVLVIWKIEIFLIPSFLLLYMLISKILEKSEKDLLLDLLLQPNIITW